MWCGKLTRAAQDEFLNWCWNEFGPPLVRVDLFPTPYLLPCYNDEVTTTESYSLVSSLKLAKYTCYVNIYFG